MSRYVGAVLLCFSIIGISCSSDVHTIKTKSLVQKNPTSYVFPGALPEVREKILKALEDFPRKREFGSFLSPNNQGFMVSVRTNEEHGSYEPIFASPENRDDLYLHSWGEPIDPSEVYFGGGKPLRYRAEFQLHLTAPDEHRTQISVITHKPTVINGSVCCSPHGYKSNDVPVEPTTIEEYRILLFIGRVLGVSDMSPVRLPEGKAQ